MYTQATLRQMVQITISSKKKKTSETDSGHYFPVTPRPTCKPNAGVWKSIKETVEKNRERKSMLKLLTRRNVPQNTNEHLSYISVVEEQPPS